MKIKHISEHFLNTLLEDGKIPSSYKSLKYTFSDKLFYDSEYDKYLSKNIQAPIITYIAFPKFLTPSFFNNELFKTKKVVQNNREGFGITINPDLNDIGQYLTNHFSKNSRAPIIKKIKRLEFCFNINYKVFFGDIDKDYYNYLMNLTHSMLIKRFNQKNDSNFILKNWKKYNDILYPLITKKKASIFVIYNEKEPIQISINFHYNKTFFAFIPAYNIDYAQFGLGNTAVYKQLEWCIQNGYEYLDMGNGDLDYKIRWCNYKYDLETHIYFKKNHILANLLAFKEEYRVTIINILKKIKNNTVLKNLKKKLPSRKPTNFNNDSLNYTSENLDTISFYETNILQEIQLKPNTDFIHLKKPLYDFLYKTKDHLNQVVLYKIENKSNTFIIKGTKKNIRISFKQSA